MYFHVKMVLIRKDATYFNFVLRCVLLRKKHVKYNILMQIQKELHFEQAFMLGYMEKFISVFDL